jgi:membrane protein implicated in regulation of membrane protease activity
MSWWLVWWVWVGLAILLGVLEMLLPVWVFLGFSTGAMVLAGLVALGLDLGLGGTLLLYALVSGVVYAGLRAWLGATGRGTERIVHDDINDIRPGKRPDGES